MIKKFLMAVFAAGSLGAQAGPVVSTSITDGRFADDTRWYTMKIASAGYYLADVEENGAMPLSQTQLIPADGNLWCFVGSDADGYAIYNRAAGPGKSLAAPVNVAGSDQGGSAYPTLKEPGVSGQCYLWNFTSSANIADSYYVYEQGYTANKLNNRGNKLAFWTAGADAGSSVVFSEVDVTDFSVSADGVVTISRNPLITLSGEIAPVQNNDGSITLGDCKYYFSTADGTVVRRYLIGYADGTTKVVNGRGESNGQIPVEGPATVTEIRPVTFAALEPSESGYVVFRYDGTPEFGIVYRIPSITTVMAGEHKGRLFSVNDYRYCGGDIGAGRIDLHMSYSDDNGKTWSVPDDMRDAQGNPVARGTGAATPAGQKQIEVNLDCGFGDPACVSDRETGEILVVACCGRMGFFGSTREDPQPSARWWSSDGGQTWTEPDYGQWEQIYALFDGTCPNGRIDGQFIGSGRIVQSSRVKVGSHYRIYCVMSGRCKDNGQISNWVLYSDDFGHNWHILGDPMQPAVPSGADEPKCEELPDGSILLAARGNGGGRNFNIFRYTDVDRAEGVWDAHINTTLGTGHGINACNGEILIVPVKNTANGQKAFMAVQSFTNSASREKVSLAWKILAEPSDYDEPADFGTWNGFYQLTAKPSAYSTMTWQADNTIGVLFEECTFGNYNYCEIYRNVTLSELTGGLWEYSEEEPDYSAYRKSMVDYVVDNIAGLPGNVVGYLSEAGRAEVQAAAEAYRADPSDETYGGFCNAYYNSTSYVMPVHGGIYSFRNAHGGLANYPASDRWLGATATELSAVGAESSATRFTLVLPEGEDDFVIYNDAVKRFVKDTPEANETTVKVSPAPEAAGRYNFDIIRGKVSIVSVNPGKAAYPAIHMNASGRPVIWTVDASASRWVMTLLDSTEDLPELSSIDDYIIGAGSGSVRYFDLQGRPVAAPRSGQLLIDDRRQKRFF